MQQAMFDRWVEELDWGEEFSDALLKDLERDLQKGLHNFVNGIDKVVRGRDYTKIDHRALPKVYTLLSCACSMQNPRVVEVILRHCTKEYIATASLNGKTALTHAIAKNRQDIVKLLLDADADVNQVPGDNTEAAKDFSIYGVTPLGVAISSKATLDAKKDMIEMLLKRNADINKPNRRGTTPIFWAVVYESPLIEFLVDKNANLEQISRPKHSRRGETPLDRAREVKNGSEAVVLDLLFR